MWVEITKHGKGEGGVGQRGKKLGWNAGENQWGKKPLRGFRTKGAGLTWIRMGWETSVRHGAEPLQSHGEGKNESLGCC